MGSFGLFKACSSNKWGLLGSLRLIPQLRLLGSLGSEARKSQEVMVGVVAFAFFTDAVLLSTPSFSGFKGLGFRVGV